jgi:hypothetical protein
MRATAMGDTDIPGAVDCLIQNAPTSADVTFGSRHGLGLRDLTNDVAHPHTPQADCARLGRAVILPHMPEVRLKDALKL